VSASSQGYDLILQILGSDADVIQFRSAQEYLDSQTADVPSCIILDFDLPDMTGLELQRRLSEKANPPIILVGNQSDVAASVSAMKAGATDFLTKPLGLAALTTALQTALSQNRRLRQRRAEQSNLQQRLGRLTPRERDVLPLVIGGLLNKQAASILQISEVTLQIHRSQVMRKMEADSLADLVRMAVKLRIPYWQQSPTPGEKRQEVSTASVRREAAGCNLYLVR
jgi:FixJ family two-component response regulator